MTKSTILNKKALKKMGDGILAPKTESEWCAYRCQLSCKIGRDVLEGKTKTPAGISPLEYALFNLLHAVEELSKQTNER